jgi:hypothetical protein
MNSSTPTEKLGTAETAVVNDQLTPDQARSLCERIRSHITDARALVLELHEKEGWKALGYESWRECVVAEFEQSQSYLYRLLDAAQIEKNISPMGEKPSRSASFVPSPLSLLNSNARLGKRLTASRQLSKFKRRFKSYQLLLQNNGRG